LGKDDRRRAKSGSGCGTGWQLRQERTKKLKRNEQTGEGTGYL
jgi:hypothetical protein